MQTRWAGFAFLEASMSEPEQPTLVENMLLMRKVFVRDGAVEAVAPSLPLEIIEI